MNLGIEKKKKSSSSRGKGGGLGSVEEPEKFQLRLNLLITDMKVGCGLESKEEVEDLDDLN